jgi:hypothetical protein
MALLFGRIDIAAQHLIDRRLKRLQPRRNPLRGLARRRDPDAPCADAPDTYRTAPESTARRPGHRDESLQTAPPSTSPSNLTFVTTDPGGPDH